MADRSDQDDRRAGRRRLPPRPKPTGTFPGVNPALVIATPGAALPGELAPLAAHRRRTKPITEQEALGVWRRKKRADIATELAEGDDKKLKRMAQKGLPAEHEQRVPDELPGWDSKKVVVTMRIHPRLRALVDALAELEGTNLTTEVELALWKLVNGPPRDPAAVRQEFEEMLAETVIPDRLERQYERVVNKTTRGQQPRQ